MLYRIKNPNGWWNSCGWSIDKSSARVYTESETMEILEKMRKDECNAQLFPVDKVQRMRKQA